MSGKTGADSRRNLMRRRSWPVWIKRAFGLRYWLAWGARSGRAGSLPDMSRSASDSLRGRNHRAASCTSARSPVTPSARVGSSSEPRGEGTGSAWAHLPCTPSAVMTTVRNHPYRLAAAPATASYSQPCNSRGRRADRLLPLAGQPDQPGLHGQWLPGRDGPGAFPRLTIIGRLGFGRQPRPAACSRIGTPPLCGVGGSSPGSPYDVTANRNAAAVPWWHRRFYSARHYHTRCQMNPAAPATTSTTPHQR